MVGKPNQTIPKAQLQPIPVVRPSVCLHKLNVKT